MTWITGFLDEQRDNQYTEATRLYNTITMKETNTHGVPFRTTRNQDWRDGLSNNIRQSIEYFSNPNNLSKEESSQVTSWVIAGTSEKNLDKFNAIAKKFNLKTGENELNGEGFGINDLKLNDISPGSSRAFKRLRRFAKKLDLELWQEVKHEIGETGAINTATITEGTFDANLNDADTATDVNGDGTPDPLWHLLPSDEANAQYGVNATGAWNNVSGEGVNVGVFDSFFDLNHVDLNSAMPTNFDWNGDGINDGIDGNANGIPDVFDGEMFTLPGGHIDWPVVPGGGRRQSHGTSVSGIALGRINGQSAIGVAPEANFMPEAFLDHQNQWPSSNYFGMADVCNHSWGRTSAINGLFRTTSPLFQANWQLALNGAIQVKSAGNSRNGWDNTNNSQLSNRGNIVVGATMANGEVEEYSTPGASVFISAPVNGSNVRWSSDNGFGTSQFTTTSDVTDEAGNNTDNRGYADGSTNTRFNGTSAAAPMVTGAVAMMLEANPSLTLRDVQHILAETSVKNGLMDSDGDGSLDSINPNAGGNAANPGSPASAPTLELRNTLSTTISTAGTIPDGHNTGWFQNGAGHWVSDSFGFGIVDAGAAANAASTWTNVSDELKATTNTILSNPYTIPEGNLGGLNSLADAGSWNVKDTLKVEWVELTLDLNLPEQDEVMLAVQSPAGTRSVLMAPGGNDSTGFNGERTLITNQFWGETSDGEWSIEVLDTNNDGDSATISNAYLDIYGTCDKESPLQVKPFSELLSDGFSLQSLAKKFLADGGANSSSYNLLSVNPYGDQDSFGTFTKGVASGLKIDQGTIFTTGKAVDAIGPNSAPNTTTNWNNPGISLLGANSKDLSGMEIRFMPKKDMVLDWKAQFGSEEFDEWSPSIFDDKAAIFFGRVRRRHARLEHMRPVNLLEGPGGGGFSVNDFSRSQSVFKEHIQMNEPCGPLTWEYDGTSKDALASKKAVLKKGKVYTIAPMIADAQDHIYDSGIIFGPNKPTLKEFDFLPPHEIKKPELFPNFSKLGKRELQKMNWSSVSNEEFSKEGINAMDLDQVNPKRGHEKRAFLDGNADWKSMIQSNGFGTKAAMTPRTGLLPDHSLTPASMEELLQHGPTFSTEMKRAFTV